MHELSYSDCYHISGGHFLIDPSSPTFKRDLILASELLCGVGGAVVGGNIGYGLGNVLGAGIGIIIGAKVGAGIPQFLVDAVNAVQTLFYISMYVVLDNGAH